MNKWAELLLGLILIIAPLLLVAYVPELQGWGAAALELIKGGIVVGVIGIGLLFLLLGLSDLKG